MRVSRSTTTVADFGDRPHQEGTYTNYENLDGKFVGVHDYLKFLKFGFGRATDHASIDIRNERIKRDEAIELVRHYEGKVPRRYLEEYLEFVGMTEDEFYETLDAFTNKAIFETDDRGPDPSRRKRRRPQARLARRRRPAHRRRDRGEAAPI